jgi:hypothetical protein
MQTPRQRWCGTLAAAALVLSAPTAPAAQVPNHLAGMSADLVRDLESRLADPSGSASEKAALTEARNLLRKGGVYNWSAQRVVWQGAAEKVGAAVGLDVNDSSDWIALQDLLAEEDPGARRARIGKLLEKQGKPAAEAEIDQALAAFDAARAESTGELARSHRQELGQEGRLQVLWRPDENRLQMIVAGREGDDPAGHEYQVVLSGNATPEPTEQGNDLQMDVQPEEDGVRAYAGEDLERLRASIFGRWNGPEGQIWEIAKTTGGGAQKQDPGGGQRQELEQARRQLEELSKQKVYVWKGPDGKVVRQQRFQRLNEPWTYEGESHGSPDAAQRIAALEQRVKTLEERASATLPVDQHDPLELRTVDLDEPQPLRITVTYANGYTYSYRRAYFDGFRITADRTLVNNADIVDLPEDVIRQLLSSWSPPEWIELEALPDAESSSVRLEGLLWRLHVTYSSGLFGSGGNEVKNIHTPYSRPLALTQPGVKSAEGAKPDELL